MKTKQIHGKRSFTQSFRREKKPGQRGFSLMALFIGIFLAAYTITLLFGLLWAVLNTFKYQDDFLYNVLGFPDKEFGWTFKNYETAFKQFYMTVGSDNTKIYIETMFLNSFLYAVGCAFFATLTPCIISYLCVKYRFRFGKVIYSIVIVTMIIPIVGSLPSELTLVKALHFVDSFPGMWFMKCNFLGLYYLVFYAAWKSVPNDFMEAGRVDGLSEFGILCRIMFPLILTTFGIVFTLNFITFWNDYQTPLLYMPKHPTISYGLYDLYNGRGAQRSSVATDVMKLTLANVVMAPIMVLFLAFKNKLIGNLTVGGIKG